jgi:hypothetical protein
MATVKVANIPTAAIPQSGAAHAQRTVSSTALLIIDGSLNASTTQVLVQFNGADARVTFDGTNPTATKGFKYVDGSSAYLSREMAIAAKAIRNASTDVVVEIQQLNFKVN